MTEDAPTAAPKTKPSAKPHIELFVPHPWLTSPAWVIAVALFFGSVLVMLVRQQYSPEYFVLLSIACYYLFARWPLEIWEGGKGGQGGQGGKGGKGGTSATGQEGQEGKAGQEGKPGSDGSSERQ